MYVVHHQVIVEEVTNGLHRRRLLHITIHLEEEDEGGMDEAAHSAEEDASPIIPL